MSELLGQGLAAMFVGMGTVLMFLCITIAAMHVMSFVVGKLNLLFPEVVTQTAGGRKVSSSNDDEITAAIIAALFRRK